MTQLYLTPMKEEHIPFLYVLLNIPEIMDALHMAPTTLANWQEAYGIWHMGQRPGRGKLHC